MLSKELADLSEQVLSEPRIPRHLRAALAREIAAHAETAAELLALPVPCPAQDPSAALVCFTAERARRGRWPLRAGRSA